MTDTAQIKQKNKKVFSGKTGSFCLEIALVFPVLMVILFAFLWQMAAIRSEMVFSRGFKRVSSGRIRQR